MKKILYFVIGILCFIPLAVSAKEPVKVYVFEAGGCPYCEEQIDYLKGLDSYKEKFVIVTKELYVDHVDWKKGKDYELGEKVGLAFEKAGYGQEMLLQKQHLYSATPFVVISDLYASAGLNNQLEEIINSAYEEGDNDAVECIKNDGENCISHIITNTDTETTTKEDTKITITATTIFWTTICSTIIIIATYLVKSEIDKRTILNNIAKQTKKVTKKQSK